MLIAKSLLWTPLTVVIGIAAAASPSNTCSRDLKPQPIGIDLGSNSIIATYAYTSKNVTTISWLTPPTYQTTIFRLRLEDFEAKQTAKILWGVNKKRENALQAIKDASRTYLSPLFTSLKANFATLKTAYPSIGNAISWLKKTASQILVSFKIKKPWFDEDLTMHDVKNIFISILNETKIAAASSDPEKGKFNTTITFAIFSVPDFFNQTLCDIVIEAAKEVGIESIPVAIARTVAAGMGAQTRGLLADGDSQSASVSKSQSKLGTWNAKGMQKIGPNYPEPTSTAINLPSKKAEKILIVEQGRFFAALRTYEVTDRSTGTKRALALSRANQMKNKNADEGGIFQQRYLPLDPYGSQIIDTKLYKRILDHEVGLKEEIRWGAGEERLRDEVARARLLIRDGLDREIGFMGRETGKKKGEEEDVDRHHEEWPLNLNGWGVGKDVQVVLKWEDVVAIEEEYVRKLAEAVHMFLVSLRRIRTTDDQTTHPETIHTAVILTDHTDGHLLIRAITQALGKDVKIVGGTLASSTLAAEGAAKLALRRLETWEEVWRAEMLKEFLESRKRVGYEEW